MSSNSIINYCEKLLIHIKKCCNAMDIDGYVDAGVIGYFIRLPFKKYIGDILQKSNYIQRK